MDNCIVQKIVGAYKPEEVEAIITELGAKIRWVPLGNNELNYPIIKTASNPWDGVTERVTNAMDAIIELHAERDHSLKSSPSPRKAVERIIGYGDNRLSELDSKSISKLSTDIQVKFYESGIQKQPTIEVLDKGIGQHPTDFSSTLLGLNNDYKIKKFYLLGSFGQGGQTSFSNCPYGIIISRKAPELLNGRDDAVGWSIVRYIDPSTHENPRRFGLWEYCVDSTTEIVPMCSVQDFPIDLQHGTIIRLVAYDLGKGTTNVLQPAGSAWSFLSQSLFDPVLPLRLYECRERYTINDRPLSGLATRLRGGGRGDKAKVDLRGSYEISMNGEGTVLVNYWALKPTSEEGWRDVRKGYVAGKEAVFITLNGQKHGSESTTFLKERAGLVYSAEYLIVQIDCDSLSPWGKKALFSSTRERLAEGSMKESLLEEVALHLRQDRNLISFEKNRKNDILNAKTHNDTSRIRKIVGKLIAEDSELRKLIFSKGKKKVEEGEGKGEETPPKDNDEDNITEEEIVVPELLDVPTYLRVTNRLSPIPVPKGGSTQIRLEMDAVDEYLEGDNFTRLRLTHQTGKMRDRSHSSLTNGKISFYVTCPSDTEVGGADAIDFELEMPIGEPLRVTAHLICTERKERKKPKVETNISEPNIKEVNKEDDIWHSLGYNEKSVGEVYLDKVDSAILVNLDNNDLVEALKKVRAKGVETTVQMVKERYVASVAYYLLLRKVDSIRKKANGNGEDDEGPDSIELQRLAKVVSALALPMEVLE